MDLSSRQFSHSRHFVFVSPGGDRRETARVSCHQIRHSDSQLLSHHRFSLKQFFKLDKRCMCLHGSIIRLRKLSPSQTGYYFPSFQKLSYLSARASSWLILVICQVRYTGYRDRPIHERQNKFLSAARDGSTEIVSILFIILTLEKFNRNHLWLLVFSRGPFYVISFTDKLV